MKKAGCSELSFKIYTMGSFTYYHLYNRTNGSELMFREPRNYDYFIKQSIKYLNGYVKVYAYCLMPTHFHLLISIPNENEKVASHQISKLFTSYAKSYNSFYNRHGSLFARHCKKSELDQ